MLGVGDTLGVGVIMSLSLQFELHLPSPSVSQFKSHLPSPLVSQFKSHLPSPLVSQFKSHLPSSLVSQFKSHFPSPLVSQFKSHFPSPFPSDLVVIGILIIVLLPTLSITLTYMIYSLFASKL